MFIMLLCGISLHIYYDRCTQHHDLGSNNCAKAYSTNTKVFNMTAHLTVQLYNVSASCTHDLWPFPAINGLDSSIGCSKIACMPA